MSRVDWRKQIQTNPEVFGGRPILKGTRITVEFVLDLLSTAPSRENLSETHPGLTEEKIRAVLAFAAEVFHEERFDLIPPMEKRE